MYACVSFVLFVCLIHISEENLTMCFDLILFQHFWVTLLAKKSKARSYTRVKTW